MKEKIIRYMQMNFKFKTNTMKRNKMIMNLNPTPMSYGEFMALQRKPIKKGQLRTIELIVVLTIIFVSILATCNPIPA